MEHPLSPRRAALRAAFPVTVPVMTGFLCLGLAYGVLMQSKGYGPLWSVLMSAVAFGGSMQFVAITLLTSAFDPLQAFLLSVMVNARHIFYGLSLLGKYRGLGRVRGFLIYTLCDETFSLVSSLDFALTALFVVLFLEQWYHRENRPAGVVGILCAAAALALFGPDNLVIPAMFLILLVLLGGRKHLCT